MACDARPLDCSEAYGVLTIDGWSLHTGAWCVPDLSSLMNDPEARGENPIAESLAGRPATSLLDDQTDHAIGIWFSGAVDRLDVSYADHVAGLFANMRALRERIVSPIRSATATLTATLTVPEDPPLVLTAEVQPLRIETTLLPNQYARGVLTLRVPDGRWV